MAFPTNIFEGCTGLFICYAQWLNTVTDGAFWTLFALAFVIVIFMASARFGVTRALGYSGVSSIFLSILLLIMNLVIWQYASLFIIAGALGLVIMRMAEG